MKLVFASDSFKGTLSSARIGALLTEVATDVLPDSQCIALRMADGGEGTLDAIGAVNAGEKISLYVHDALMRPVRCKIIVDDDRAFVEAASTCGLSLLTESERNPFMTTSHGVGECVLHALYHGCTHIAVGLGGSCTNDGGMGFLRALGMRFFDERGSELAGCGADLARVSCIDADGLYPIARSADFTVLGDVTNPLLGPTGATRVFGGQKGADAAALDALEAGMENFARVIAETCPGVDFDTPGFGAAGGLGMALSVFLDAQLNSGIETLLQWLDFDNVIADADLVVTGEGKLDEQSLHGKVVSGVAGHARRAGVPVAVICGTSELDAAQLAELGVSHVAETSAERGADYAQSHAEEAFLSAAKTLFKNVR